MTTPDRVVEVPREKLAEWLDWAEEIGLGIEYGKGIRGHCQRKILNT